MSGSARPRTFGPGESASEGCGFSQQHKWGFPKYGESFREASRKDYSICGSILGPLFWEPNKFTNATTREVQQSLNKESTLASEHNMNYSQCFPIYLVDMGALLGIILGIILT